MTQVNVHPPDSEGHIDWSSCTGLVSKDYSSYDDIGQYIPHGGTFYLYLVDSSSFFNKVVSGYGYVDMWLGPRKPLFHHFCKNLIVDDYYNR